MTEYGNDNESNGIGISIQKGDGQVLQVLGIFFLNFSL